MTDTQRRAIPSHYTPRGDAIYEGDLQPMPPGGGRYARSRARRMDDALRQGGQLAAIAEQLGVSLTVLRVHIHDRVASGHWRFETTAGEQHGSRFLASAGRLREAP